jgi:membrane-associated phospholipid phosphatase
LHSAARVTSRVPVLLRPKEIVVSHYPPLLLAGGDTSDFLKVNDLARHTAWLHSTAVAYANYGVLLFGLLLLAGGLLARRSPSPAVKARALLAPIGVLVAVAANQPIVHAVHEPRPYTTLPHALLLVHRSVDASFPSDHATMAGAVAAGLMLVSWRLGLAAVFAALVMAFTRVYVGAHYPIDVLAGLVVGAVVATVVVLASAKPAVRLVQWGLTTRLRPVLTDNRPPSSAAINKAAGTGDRVAPMHR